MLTRQNRTMGDAEVTWTFGMDSDYGSKIMLNKSTAKPKEELTCIDLSTFTNFHAAVFAIVLEDAIVDINLLSECNNELRITKLKSDMAQLIRAKFDIKEPDEVDELAGIDHSNLQCNQYKLDKLAADRLYIRGVFVSCFLDLIQKKSFDTLNKYVNEITGIDKYRVSVTEDVASNKCINRDLIKQLRQQRNHIKSVVYDADVTIDELKNQVEDAVLMAEVRSRYMENWQRARAEQHEQSLHDKENVPNSSLKYYQQRGESEHRAHLEVESLTNLIINETLNKIDEWMNKYDKDMEGIDLQIQIKKNDYQNTRDKRINLEETYVKHEQLMEEWIHFKEEREKARIYHETMTKSAIVVQAWWRGLLVRRELGPYRVSKKKGKKKK